MVDFAGAGHLCFERFALAQSGVVDGMQESQGEVFWLMVEEVPSGI